MNSKAFNITSNNEDKDFYPNDCQIDTSLDNDIINFFKSQKNEEDTYYLSKKTKNKKDLSPNPKEHIEKNKKLKKTEYNENVENENGIYADYDDDDNEESNEEEGEEESSSSSELIYSTFPDNIEITKKSIYEKMHINTDLIAAVIEEYLKTKNKFLKELNKGTNEEDIPEEEKFIISPKEFSKYDLPKDNFIKKSILPYKSNEYLMKNINKCFKVIKNCNKTNKDQLNKVSEWLYTFLLFLEMPISPDNSADLYSINKYIYNNFMKANELKIIFIIICEIFKQILVL